MYSDVNNEEINNLNSSQTEKDIDEFRNYEKLFKHKIEQKKKLQKNEDQRLEKLLKEVNDLRNNKNDLFEKVDLKSILKGNF
jgi:hypothetical protein